MKYFRMGYEETVNKRSYKNLMLLSAAIPSFKSGDDEDGKGRHRRHKPKHANEIFDNLL